MQGRERPRRPGKKRERNTSNSEARARGPCPARDAVEVSNADVARMADQKSLARLHYELIKALIEHGTCPSISVLAERLGARETEVEGRLSELASIHGLVLHPHIREPWIVHPF